MLGENQNQLLDLSGAQDFLTTQRPFKGRYQTELYDGVDEYGRAEKRLLIPEAYKELLQFGGVVTVGVDENLLLFSNTHWEYITRALSRQFDATNPNSAAMIRHIYGRHSEFSKPNDDGSIGLNTDLVSYANLKQKIILVGLIYYAEIHDADHFYSSLLSADDTAKLAAALKI